MKYFLFQILFLILTSFTPFLQASDKTLLCFPDLDPSYRQFNFQIKPSHGTCEKDEKIYEVKKVAGGVILFFPYDSSNPTSQPTPSAIPTTPKTGKSIF